MAKSLGMHCSPTITIEIIRATVPESGLWKIPMEGDVSTSVPYC